MVNFLGTSPVVSDDVCIALDWESAVADQKVRSKQLVSVDILIVHLAKGHENLVACLLLRPPRSYVFIRVTCT